MNKRITTPTAELLSVTNSEGTPFHVRLVRVGERYGRDDCLTHGDAMYGRPAKPDALPLIEFYDARDTDKFGTRGQFVSRYCFGTVATCARDNRGVHLHGSSPSWFLDADNIRDAFAWASVKLASS